MNVFDAMTQFQVCMAALSMSREALHADPKMLQLVRDIRETALEHPDEPISVGLLEKANYLLEGDDV
jgi:hypothetical protein